MSRGGHSLSSTKISAVRVLLCNVTQSLKEAVVDPTWVQSSVARYGMFGLFCSEHHGVHSMIVTTHSMC